MDSSTWQGFTLTIIHYLSYLNTVFKVCVPSTPSLKGDKVDASDLRNILKDLGIELTEKEQESLLKTLPVDGELAGRLRKLCFVPLFLSVGLCTTL